jgi:hypothetical protein
MEKTRKIGTILVVAVAFCFLLISLAEAFTKSEKNWMKNNFPNKNKTVSIPIWQITQGGTAKSVKWVDHAPNPRFAIYDPGTPGDETDDVVLDKETGLVWARDGNLGGQKIWQDAMDYSLDVTLGNRKGWRLPAIQELQSLVDPSQSNPALPSGHPFTSVQSYYWSSTPDSDNERAYQMNSTDSSVVTELKTNDGYIWLVRGGKECTTGNEDVLNLLRDEVIPYLPECYIYEANVPKTGQTTLYATGDDGDLQKGVAWPDPRFTDNGDGTVTDNMTGLMWTKDAQEISGTMTWSVALTACNDLVFPAVDGYDDWRLPNARELLSLIDYEEFNPALPEGCPITDVQDGHYWSSTTYKSSILYAWSVEVNHGYVSYPHKENLHYVWPVRGGK